MTHALIKLDNPVARERAVERVRNAPDGFMMEIREPRRSTPQNDRLWASLTDVSSQLDWHGVRLDPADWKLIFMAALNKEMRLVPNIDNNGFVNLGQSSSKLSKSEFSDLLEIIYAFGAQRGVTFHDGQGVAA